MCGSEGDELLLIDQIGAEKNIYEEPEKEAVLNEIVVGQLLLSLEERERKIITLRYFENKTQCEVAAILHMTQVQVSRSERKTLQKLRKTLL